jgi:hypothetical protein
MYNPWIVPRYRENWGESGKSSPLMEDATLEMMLAKAGLIASALI